MVIPTECSIQLGEASRIFVEYYCTGGVGKWDSVVKELTTKKGSEKTDLWAC